MFTGLVEVTGTLESLSRTGAGARLTVAVRWPDGGVPKHGDSVAVNGACLTVVGSTAKGFAADLSSETLSRTLLGELRQGEEVNLERALRMGDRIGGHLVQGHVDAVVGVVGIHPEGGFSRWRLSLPSQQAHEVALKGSVAVHGVSLTVSGLGDDWFEVALIPETLRASVLHGGRVGTRLHLETDVLAKYVARSAGDGRGRSAVDRLFGPGGGDA